ncbi:hypothetical protein ACHAXR_006967, partial [Thalassiosira sp. AJA248-18]
ILCLHGWLDNAASFDRLAPLLLADDDIPTEIVCLDFPGHGLSGHKSVDGPPQGKGNNNGGNGNKKDNDHDKIMLIGHSMGAGVSVILCAAFSEWFSSVVLLEGALVARNSHDASRHVRAACQRRLKSNRTLFPNGSNNSADGETALPRSKVYRNLDAAIQARLSTTERMPGDQFLSYEAARDMVMRATAPASSSSSTTGNEEAVVFRHDPRLQWPSLQYYTREQVEAFLKDVHAASSIPVCLLWAADGWPMDAWSTDAVKNVLKPEYVKRLAGSHHFHADPDSFSSVANEIIMFMEEKKL